MPKSKYLDSIITNKIYPNAYKLRYLTAIWDGYGDTTVDTYRAVNLRGFTAETVPITVAGNAYLTKVNSNQTVRYMSSNYIGTNFNDKMTINPEALPNNRDSKNSAKSAGKATIQAPPDYLTAQIISIKGESSKTIPVLFPSSFSRSISANYARENPVGSNKPIMAFSYTDAEEIPLEFDALADYLPTGYSFLNDYVEDILAILKPATSGNWSNGGQVIYEPRVKVELADISFEGVCTSVNVSYDNLYTTREMKNTEGKTEKRGSFVHAKISCQFVKLS